MGGECECVVGGRGGAENLRPVRTETGEDEEDVTVCELRTLGANIEGAVGAVVMYEEEGMISELPVATLLP